MPSPLRTRPPLLPAAVLAAAFALLAWVVLARHGAPYPFDTRPHRWSVAHRPHGLVTAARVVTDAGTGPYPYVIAAGGGWLAGSRGRTAGIRSGVSTALLAVAALLAEQAVRGALMLAFHRARPPRADWAAPASGHSFPSGHSASSAMAAGLLAWGLLRTWPGAPGRVTAAVCVLYTAAVGCTRVYLGVHWPTDVIGGWLYAGCCLALVLPPLTAYLDRTGRAGPNDPADQNDRSEPAGQTETP
jgi:membrane-associated phospholipid phosphatase